MTKLLARLLVVLAVLALPGVAAAKPAQAKDTRVQLLAINDLHGHLAANTPGTVQVGCCAPVIRASDGVQTGWTQNTVPAGGITYLAKHIKKLRSGHKNTLTVGAGDLIGASPLTSALFHDEPTIEALNSIGLDVSGVGNHEFDEGVDELLRMQYGNQLGGDGCHPEDGCQDGTPFGGSLFQYLAANVFYENTDDTILPPYEVHTIDGAKIAFIGLTFEDTPTVVTPSAVDGLDFEDEVETVNALVEELRSEQGVRGVRHAAAPGRQPAATLAAAVSGGAEP